jgi:hypothetical protein
MLICLRCALTGLLVAIDWAEEPHPFGRFQDWYCPACHLYGARLIPELS